MSSPEGGRYRRCVYVCGVFILIFFLAYYIVVENDIVDYNMRAKKVYTWWHYAPVNESTSLNDSSSAANDSSPMLFPERAGKLLRIAYWTTVLGVEGRWGWSVRFPKQLDSCPDLKDKCVFTGDRSQYNNSDVLLFHMRDSFKVNSYRPPFQKWVFAIMESPTHTYVDLDKHRWLFNITMTYKRSSEVAWDYGHCSRKSDAVLTRTKNNTNRNFADGKKHLAAWFVSNCGTQSKREVYVRELMKYIDVHKYGCGGKYSCSRSKHNHCDAMLNSTYKFYLSFENSLCEDYITEKAYRILNLNVVPIVLGHGNYSDVLPPHSFIHVGDYESPKVLAEYLHMLNKNDTLYNEYFKWHETHTCVDRRVPPACRLCEFALRERQRIQTVDIKHAWGRQETCISPKQYYRGMNLM